MTDYFFPLRPFFFWWTPLSFGLPPSWFITPPLIAAHVSLLALTHFHTIALSGWDHPLPFKSGICLGNLH